MADVDIAPHFGAELKDAFKPINAWVGGGIAWLDDIQAFYRERSAIEKEYSAKLAALAAKYFEKKAKKSSSLSVGDTPAMTPGSLESASLTTWTTQLTTLESRAAEHESFANELVINLAEPLKTLGIQYEGLRKKHIEYAGRLEGERDAAYADLRKTKAKYDTACQEVENKRKKAEGGAFGGAKAQHAYQTQLADMNNVKNTYLIALRVTNKQKEKYYQEYIPDLLDSLQDLHELRTVKLNALWLVAAKLESGMLGRSTQFIGHLANEIPRNLPVLDTMMYVRHNVVQGWQEPGDRVFEPSPVWHDDDTMIVDESAKVFLRNVLSKSKGQLGELKREVDKKRRELENIKKIKQAIRNGRDKRDEVEVVGAQFKQQEELHVVDHKRLTAEVETFAITAAVGDVTLGAKSHNFKSQTFKIPTNCDLCGERIWGLSAKGFDCRDCGYTCHSKCEMKVPAECPGEQNKEERKKLKAERQEAANSGKSRPMAGTNGSHAELGVPMERSNTMTSLSSGYAVSAHRSISGMPRSPMEDGPKELEAPPVEKAPVAANRKPRILAPPPIAYISEAPGSVPDEPSGPMGKMLYPYDANTGEELTVTEGREVAIVEPDDGSGWMKVQYGSRTGLVPASYVELLPATDHAPPIPATSTRPDSHRPNSSRPDSTYSNSSSISTTTSNTASGGAVVAKKKGPAVAPRRGAKKLRYVEAMYAYSPQSEAEHEMVEGERFVLVAEDGGDGWMEVEKGGRTASVPASYVRAV